MFCKKCGSPVDDKAKFCKKCGTPVENVSHSLESSSALITSVKGLQINAQSIAFLVLVLQIAQIALCFVPVFKLSMPRYGESFSYTVMNALDELGYFDTDFTSVTCLLTGLSIISIVFTLLNIFKIYKLELISYIVRFVSCGFTTFWAVGIWSFLVMFCYQAQKEEMIIVNMNTNFGGILLYILNIVLFVSLIALIRYRKKNKNYV